MTQQKFYKNDKVKRVKDFSMQVGCVEDIVYTVVDIVDNQISVDDRYYVSTLRDADKYELLERAWQPNTGVQPVDDVIVEVTLKNGDVRKDYADDLFWSEGGIYTVVRWRLADSNPATLVKDFRPSHVAVGSELVSTDVQEVVDTQKKNKYTREIKPNVFVDVYDVLRAFNVTDPCLSHLCKKALCAGLRGHKDRLTDLQDIKASIERAIEMHKEWEK